MDDPLTTIRQWQSRLTGLPEATFDAPELSDKVAMIEKAWAAHVVWEQVALLWTAQALEENGVSPFSLAVYFGTREVKAKPTGKFNAASGIQGLPRRAAHAILPLLRLGAYRPYLTTEIARSLVALAKDGALGGAVSPVEVANVIYLRGMSPTLTMKTLNTMKEFAKSHPEAAVAVWQAIAGVRESAVEAVAEGDAAAERIEGMEDALTGEGAAE